MDHTTLIDGHSIKILDGPYLTNGEPTADAISFSRQLISALPQAAFFGAEKLVDNYNQVWREDGSDEDFEEEPVLTSRDLADKLGEASIIIYDALGSAVILFKDSGLFCGHSIVVSYSDGEFTHASLYG